jgi:NADPH-dependent curcumin reductase CurA
MLSLQNLELKNELQKFAPQTLKKYIENGGERVIDNHKKRLKVKNQQTQRT